MKINELLLGSVAARMCDSTPEVDPLTDEDALQGAQVLDIRFDAMACVAGILFELRQALQLREANTGVLIAHGVHEIAWSGPNRDTALTAWSVGSSFPQAKGVLFGLNLVMWPHPGAQLSLTAERAAFFVGNVPGLTDAPPDYTNADRVTLGRKVAGWDSSFEPAAVVFLDRTVGGGLGVP